MPVKDLKTIYSGMVFLYYRNDEHDFEEHLIWTGDLRELPSEYESLEIFFIFPYSDLLYVAIEHE
ncbi:MAG: hypothetical protein HFH88_14810 [Lachnospiraceae bacterium]|nr:hypothetical protein [Lachnospiraceae bacterium]